MKVLGIKQFHQKIFKLFNLAHTQFKDLLVEIPKGFIAVIYGFSGNGKTEFCIQLAKVLTQFGKVAWFSYEQGHSKSLQKATTRNKMQEVSGSFLVIDPTSDRTKGVSFLEDLDNYLSRKNSPDFVFIDSVDYTGFSWDDYVFLKEKYATKKGLFFIAHSTKNGILKKRISEQIVFDGEIGFFVKDYICFPEKNRLEGTEPFVVWDEGARRRNPAFFTKRLQEQMQPDTQGEKPKKKQKQ
jgi:energy-coupling factor transporter ATP-binding protein EcfA2